MSSDNSPPDDLPDFVIPGALLQEAVNTLAQLPYVQVGDLVNKLRVLPQVPSEEPDAA